MLKPYGRLLEVYDWSYREIFKIGVHGPMGRTVEAYLGVTVRPVVPCCP